MDIPLEQWATVSALLDDALDLAPELREQWLRGLDPAHASLLPVLRRLLEQSSRIHSTDFLATLPGMELAGSADEKGSHDELAAGDEVGPYRLLRPLGQGGMGTVWLAERSDGLLARQVALKLPHLMGERRALARRFARERQILAALNHPNIARLYDAGISAQGRPYLALEFVQGQTLTAYCDARRLGLQERIHLFLQALEAVRFAHANLVVHRDLKPSNLLVTDEGQVRLLDFGISKLLDEENTSGQQTELTRIDGVAFTPQYAAPEQILGKTVGTTTDVYSLGVILYELLVGALPYRLRRETRVALEEAILVGESPRPSTVVGGDEGRAAARGTSARRLARQLRGDLDSIAGKALKKEPAQRYLSVESFAQDLRNWLAGSVVQARPDSAGYRLHKFVARNWLSVTAVSGVVFALAAGLGIALWQASRAQQAQNRADEVKHFIASIFTDTRPAEGKGGIASAAELLIRASERVPRELSSNPFVAVELNYIIADGLENLGEPGKARQILEQALRRDGGALGERDPGVLRLKIKLAGLYLAEGELAKAEPLVTSATAELRQLGRAGAADLVLGIRILANLQFDHGGDQCVATAREGVAVAERWLDVDDPQRAFAMTTLVGMLRLRQQVPEALTVAQKAVDLARRTLGAKRPNEILGDAEQELAFVLAASGRPAEAASLQRQVVADLVALHGGQSSNLETALSVLARALRLSGHQGEAIDNYRRSIAIRERNVKGPERDLAAYHHGLGIALVEARRPQEALAQMQIGERMWMAAGGKRGTRWARERQLDRAEALGYLARTREASLLLESVAGELEKAGPNGDATKQWSRVAQLRSLLLRLDGRAPAAAEVAAASLRRSAQEALDDRSRAQLDVALGLATLDTGRALEARPLLEDGLQAYEAAQVSLSPRVADALLGLGRADLALGKVEAALASLKRAHEFWQQFDAQNLWSAEAALWYGRALLASGQAGSGRALVVLARPRLAGSPFAALRQEAAAKDALASTPANR